MEFTKLPYTITQTHVEHPHTEIAVAAFLTERKAREFYSDAIHSLFESYAVKLYKNDELIDSYGTCNPAVRCSN